MTGSKKPSTSKPIVKGALAKLLRARGIVAETPTLGFNKAAGKWYGWYHTSNVFVINGFTIGSGVRTGNCAYIPLADGGHGAWTARTLADARQMAVDFAANVARS